MKEQELKYYKQFTEFLTKYEQSQDKLALQNQSSGNPIVVVKLIESDSKANLKNNLDELNSELMNPFKHVRNWIKGEMLGLAALIAAIAEKENCDVRKGNAIKRLRDDREMNKKLGEGKFVLKNVFKGKNNKAK